MKQGLWYAIILLCLLPFAAQAQNWAWMGGVAERTPQPSYGTMGVESPTNYPGHRQGGAMFRDATGNLWLFGGTRQDATMTQLSLNDLWKYSAATGMWTWMKGSSASNPTASYGTKGVEASSNTPGGMAAPESWTDAAGNLWVYNGELWKYSPASGNWTWMGGTSYAAVVYGSIGVEDPANWPGGRTGTTGWTDAGGNLWLFGGGLNGYRSDLWKYNIATGCWAWMAGSSSANQYGVYGTMGVEDAANAPGSRWSAVSWRDASGDFWLFGGSGNAASTGGLLNDLWRYRLSTGQWTWMKGSNTSWDGGVYGTKGVPNTANRPEAKRSAGSWSDAENNLWLFGGNINGGGSNDVWRYNIASNTWTWMKGSPSRYQSDVYGTMGVPDAANSPGSRQTLSAFTGDGGSFWIYAGSSDFHTNDLSDFWKYDVATNAWTWMAGTAPPVYGVYGTMGVAAASNWPGMRSSAATWKGADNTLWMFGGDGVAASTNGYLSDLWKYDVGSGEWTWMKGSNGVNAPGSYGTKNVEAPGNGPGARRGAVTWTDAAGNLWMFGGEGYYYAYQNDLWKYNPASGNWTWISGSSTPNAVGSYGTMGVESPTNVPKARVDALSWMDANGNLWLFGGYARVGTAGYTNPLNDLWKYNMTTGYWTWMKGSDVNAQPGTYGTMGIGDPANTPGARYKSTAWKDAAGHLWLFGGLGYSATSSSSLNDLWEFDIATGNWTWMKGSNGNAQPGVYGTMNVESPSNFPGARYGAVGGMDALGNFYLFGGIGNGYSSSTGYLNDLWKYNVATGNWVWIKGANSPNQSGVVFGAKGVPAAANRPFSPSEMMAWNSANGYFWIFGGATSIGRRDDFWRMRLGLPPVANCRNVEVPVSTNCSASANIDNGSYDPDGGQVTLTQWPPAPYWRGTTNVTLTATDEDGMSSTCTGAVTVTGDLPEITITANPSTPVNPGGAPNTVYVGYGPQYVTLTASANGGTSYEWYDWEWNYIGSTPSVTVTPLTAWYAYGFSDVWYRVWVCNAQGCCNGYQETYLLVVDVRCGNNMNDVVVCHRCQSEHTVCIGPSSVQAHLNHGDYLGYCANGQKTVEREGDIPASVVLESNYPNPFNPATTIRYGIPADAHVSLRVFDVHGRQVAELVNGATEAGTHEAAFDAGALPSGLYLYRLEAMGKILTGQMTLMK